MNVLIIVDTGIKYLLYESYSKYACEKLLQEIHLRNNSSFEFSKVYSRHLVIETSDGKITLLFISFLENRG